MADIRDAQIEVNGIRLHVSEAGEGPLVVLLHGFPESSHSFRHQLSALAGAGFHAVAPDQRGYPGTTLPSSPDDFTIHHLAGDVVGLINALGAADAVVAGHDWGSPVASAVAHCRPDLVRGVACLSVPFQRRSRFEPLEGMRRVYGSDFYQLYFQEPGVAELEFDGDPSGVLRKMFFWYSGSAPEVLDLNFDDKGMTGSLPVPAELPEWLSEEDLAVYAEAFGRHGFTGAFNWYRNVARNWELTSAWSGQRVSRPAMFLGGDRDPVLKRFDLATLAQAMAPVVSDLRSCTLLEGAGHWIQQERPEETSAALIDFARSL